MNEDTIEGKTKQNWSIRADDRLDVIEGKRDELEGEIRNAYGVTQDEARAQAKGFEDLDTG